MKALRHLTGGDEDRLNLFFQKTTAQIQDGEWIYLVPIYLTWIFKESI